MLVKYADKKAVHVLTTEHSHSGIEKRGKVKPASVIQYNSFMGGVDRTDQVSGKLLFIYFLSHVQKSNFSFE